MNLSQLIQPEVLGENLVEVQPDVFAMGDHLADRLADNLTDRLASQRHIAVS